MAHNLHRDYEQGRAQLSIPLRELMERGREYKAIDYARAITAVAAFNEALDPIFDEFDAILTPAAAGEAPRGLTSTGNPVFCTTWTYLGTPAITLPLLRSEAGMPLGVQLVARRHNDARLLRTARWLVNYLGGSSRRAGRKAASIKPAKAPRKGKSS
jgi:Asp-tRNA(Asn)/Glu-tRNA(Gln) amidotransferase A subunit family amidase